MIYNYHQIRPQKAFLSKNCLYFLFGFPLKPVKEAGVKEKNETKAENKTKAETVDVGEKFSEKTSNIDDVRQRLKAWRLEALKKHFCQKIAFTFFSDFL